MSARLCAVWESDNPLKYLGNETMRHLRDSELIEHICEENNKFPGQIGLEPTR
jgi:hypothetical protein